MIIDCLILGNILICTTVTRLFTKFLVIISILRAFKAKERKSIKVKKKN